MGQRWGNRGRRHVVAVDDDPLDDAEEKDEDDSDVTEDEGRGGFDL